jgi:hypothetical protein
MLFFEFFYIIDILHVLLSNRRKIWLICSSGHKSFPNELPGLMRGRIYLQMAYPEEGVVCKCGGETVCGLVVYLFRRMLFSS